jgi:hypothetical protein
MTVNADDGAFLAKSIRHLSLLLAFVMVLHRYSPVEAYARVNVI